MYKAIFWIGTQKASRPLPASGEPAFFSPAWRAQQRIDSRPSDYNELLDRDNDGFEAR